MRLYHGTCASKLPSIQIHGLRAPVYLTDDPRIAAIVASDPDWCEDPMILSVDLSDDEVSRLRPDYPMLLSPMYGKEMKDNEERVRLLRRWDKVGEAGVSGKDTLRAVHSAISSKKIAPDRLDVLPRESGDAIRWAMETVFGVHRRPVRVRSYHRRSR